MANDDVNVWKIPSASEDRASEALEADADLLKGNIALAKAALNAGLQCFFGYPITPQNEIGEFLSEQMPKMGRVFLQSESEVASINMLLGAASTGTIAMTSSSSCAIALMQETISYICADDIPAVVVSVMRAGPALGYIHPSQSDYFQTVKGGGNGDYKVLTLAPSNVQEMIDFTYRAFYLSQKYRTLVFVLADGLLGQMMEPATVGKYPYPYIDPQDWALDGAKNRNGRWIGSIQRDKEVLRKIVEDRFSEKYAKIAQDETDQEEFMCEGANILITAFGSVARIAKEAVLSANEMGIKVGLVRPITLWPFPNDAIYRRAKSVKKVLNIEMNMGQMLEDVKIAVAGATPIEFMGRAAGEYFSADEILEKIIEVSASIDDKAVK